MLQLGTLTAKRQINQNGAESTTASEWDVTMSEQKPIKVSILATPDTLPSTLFGLHDVLSSVGLGWEIFISGENPAPRFEVKIVSVENESFICKGCGGRVRISPDASIQQVEDTDIVLLASFVPNDTVSLRDHDERELEWLSRLRDRGSVLASMCTSTALFAEAGFLNGLQATTFWAYRDLVRIRYPQVDWRIDQNLCIAGADDQIITAGGSTIWQELALYLVARFCGPEQARNASKLWLIPDRDMSQASFSMKPKSLPHNDSVINQCQTWVAQNYTSQNPIAGMMQQAGLASTTFSRRFKRATGDRPIDYIHMLRIERAKKILETSGKRIEQIGFEIGYEDPASFRRIFKRKVGLTPSYYRRQFSHSNFARFKLA